MPRLEGVDSRSIETAVTKRVPPSHACNRVPFAQVKRTMATEIANEIKIQWWGKPLALSFPRIREREEQVFLVLTPVIGMLDWPLRRRVHVPTENLGMRLYPVGSAAWRRED